MKNKNLFKKVIIIAMSMLSVNFAFADSCIMISPDNITKVECQNSEVISIHVLNDLCNEKKSVIVSSKKDGVTDFYIKLKNKKCDFKANVSDGKLKIDGNKYIKVLPIDLPPEFVSCDKYDKGDKN